MPRGSEEILIRSRPERFVLAKLQSPLVMYGYSKASYEAVHAMAMQKQYVPEYPRGILLFWDLACVGVTQDAMKILRGCMGCRDNRGCQDSDSDSFLCRCCLLPQLGLALL
jgi:hypothetical protein